MCGIVGKIGCWTETTDELRFSVKNMADTLHHRGPDDAGIYVNTNNKIGLGHTRLSILDLDKTGHQPMISRDGNYVLVFNGEVYNYLELKAKLTTNNSNIVFKGHSDTEILLEYICEFGLNNTLQIVNGMFAFALYNIKTNIIHLIRDRAGVKPLFIAYLDKLQLAFASEVRAFKTINQFKTELSQSSISDVFSFGYIKQNRSIYKNVYSVPPGCCLNISLNNRNANFQKIQTASLNFNYTTDTVIKNEGWELQQYWFKSRNYYLEKNHNNINESVDSIYGNFKQLLKNAVKLRLVADVPVGLFLSSGIDSTLITSLSKEIIGDNVNTFSIGFNNNDFDEGSRAEEISKILGVKNTLFRISEDECLEYTLDLTNKLDEPFGDASLLPTYIVSKLARQEVKVALTGDGADELFAGYKWYDSMQKVCKLYQLFNWNNVFEKNDKPIKYKKNSFVSNIRYNIELLKYLLTRNNLRDCLVQLHRNPKSENIVDNYLSLKTNNDQLPSVNNYQNYLDMFLHHDYNDILPYCFLTKVDRASMLNSLECRSPFMDYRIHNFAGILPTKLKLHNGVGKVLLKKLLNEYLPKEFIYTKKRGFSVPTQKWIKGPLKPLIMDIANDTKVLDKLQINRSTLKTILDQHFHRNIDHGNLLWNLIVTGTWVNNNF